MSTRFSGRVDDYVKTRPSYPRGVLTILRDTCGLGPSSVVADLGSGTGLFTRLLLESGASVHAVEPNDEMRGVLAGRSAGVRVLAGTAERMPLPDACADAVFVGDAFHWFDGSAAVAELARVVRPGGGVALLWNHWWSDGDDGTTNSLDPPLPPGAQALFDEVYFSSGRAKMRADMPDPVEVFAGGPFDPIVEEAFPRTEGLTGMQVIDLYATVSAVASLPPGERAELKRRLASLVDPSYRLRITTELHWTRRG